MSDRAARLTIILVVALGVRAASGQYPPPPVPPPGQPFRPPANQPQFQPPQYQPQQAAYSVPPPAMRAEVFKPAQILARVGDQFIFYGDVAPTVEMMIDSALVKAKTEAERQGILAQRQAALQPVLQQYIQTKTMYLAFDREMRKNTKDKYAESRGKMEKEIHQKFNLQLKKFHELMDTAKPDEVALMMRQSPVVGRLALLMRDHKLESLGELESLLRSLGTSLDQQVVQFGEYALGRDMAGRHFKQKHEVTHQEMLDYYEQHADDFRIAAKARFELLSAKLANYNDDRAATDSAVGAMGNRVIYGTPFAAVAQQQSQEPNASQGGQYDWVNKGSLASKPIDEAVFSLEPGKLSTIINDDLGCHIVRVHERHEAGMVSFVDAQPKIKDIIEQQKREAETKKFLELLQKNTEVWTIFDPPR